MFYGLKSEHHSFLSYVYETTCTLRQVLKKYIESRIKSSTAGVGYKKVLVKTILHRLKIGKKQQLVNLHMFIILLNTR